MGQECCAEEPTTERDGRGGGLFRFGKGKRRGNVQRGKKGLWLGSEGANAASAQSAEVNGRQVQLWSRFGRGSAY